MGVKGRDPVPILCQLVLHMACDYQRAPEPQGSQGGR